MGDAEREGVATLKILIPDRGLCLGGEFVSVVPADSNSERVLAKMELTGLGARCGEAVSFPWVEAF